MRRIRRFAGIAVGLLVAVTVAGGCGSGTAQANNTFSAYLCEPKHLIPGNTQEACGLQVATALFTGLISYDPRTSEPREAMAKSITSDDNRVWTIELERGWTFHNGEPVTARSYVRAWNYAAYGPHGWVHNRMFSLIEGYGELNPTDPDGPKGPKKPPKPTAHKLSGLEVTGKHTFRVTLSEPASQFPVRLGHPAFYPLPEVAYEDFDAYGREPIGNGPFRMAAPWEHGQRIELVRYEEYGGPNAKAAGVTFKIYSSVTTAYNDLLAGDLDVMQQLPFSKMSDARQRFGERYIEAPSSALTYLALPLYEDAYAAPELRRALSMAINRRAVIRATAGGGYTPAHSLISPIVPGHRPNACGEDCRYNPRKARQLFEEAGALQDGTLTLWFHAGVGHDGSMKAIANQLRQTLGINKVELRSQPFARYIGAVRSQQVTGPFRMAWVMGYPSAQNYLEPLFHSQGSANLQGYSNPEVDKLIEKGNSAPSQQQALRYYHRAEDIILHDMPVIPLWFSEIHGAHSEQVSNVTIDPRGHVRVAQVQVTG